MPSDEIDIQAGTDAECISWFGMQEVPDLAFDHAHILAMAYERLRAMPGDSTAEVIRAVTP